MVTIADLKNSAESHVDHAKRAGQQVYNLLVVESSILNEVELKNLRIANSCSWAGHVVLNDIHDAKAVKLDEETAKDLLRRFNSSLRRFIEMKCDAEGIGVLYTFITVLELVIKESDFEE